MLKNLTSSICLPIHWLIALSLFLPWQLSAAADPVTDSFTDSQGRTTQYRYSLKDDWDKTHPRGALLYFHGNNSNTQSEILDMFFWGVEQDAYARDLIPVVITSPDTRTDGTTRQWYDEDQQMLKELIASDFEGAFKVDTQKIIFSGGSQGTCFLHDFIMAHGENYGGGFYGGCGCYNSPNPIWEPSEAFKANFKVLVHATTGDFLYDTSQTGYAYYKYTIGLDTRGDLHREGEHCSASHEVEGMAYDWILGLSEIPEEPEQTHWKRISTMNEIAGMVVDAQNVLWVAQQTGENQVSLWKSADRGANWALVNQLDGVAHDFFRAGNSLFLNLDFNLYRSDDNGANFQLATDNNSVRSPFASDTQGRLFSGNPLSLSTDAGNNWEFLQKDDNYLYLADSHPHFIVSRVIANGGLGDTRYLSFNAGQSWSQVNNTPVGTAYSFASDGQRIWALAGTGENGYQLYQSNDQTQNWSPISLPSETSTYYNATAAKVSHLNSGQLLVYGAWNNAWLSADNGNQWQRIYGAESIGRGNLAQTNDGGAVYVTSGAGIFLLPFTEADNNTAQPNPDTGTDTGAEAGNGNSSEDWQRVMDWAESTLPALFPSNGKQSISFPPFEVRYYPSTGIYLGYNSDDQHFYGYNPQQWGPELLRFGALSEYLALATQAGF